MRKRTILIAASVLLIAVAGAVGLLAHRAGTTEKIADGISIGDISVGGLNADGAHSELKSRVIKELGDPVVVNHQGQSFTLTAGEAKVGVDVDGAVRLALQKTREGNIFERAWRELAKKDVKAEIPLEITFSKAAVDTFLAQLKTTFARHPVDASLHFTHSKIETRPSSDGVEVLTAPLRKRIARALREPGRRRTFLLPTRVLEPKVREDELAQRNPVVVTVDRKKFRLTIFKNLKQSVSYPIAVGKEGMETPTGLYQIYNKQINPKWTVPDDPEEYGDIAGTVIPGGAPENGLKARWLGIVGDVGIHGTGNEASLGSAASHGCVRMAVKDVIKVYNKVPLHSPVFIH